MTDYKGKHEKQTADEMPCDKKGCDASTRASCCGCPEYFEWQKSKNLVH